MTGIKDDKFHLYEQTMIGSPQQGKFNKRRNNSNRCKHKSTIVGATKDTRVGKEGTPV
jgi:hypothetical protein